MAASELFQNLLVIFDVLGHRAVESLLRKLALPVVVAGGGEVFCVHDGGGLLQRNLGPVENVLCFLVLELERLPDTFGLEQFLHILSIRALSLGPNTGVTRQRGIQTRVGECRVLST